MKPEDLGSLCPFKQPCDCTICRGAEALRQCHATIAHQQEIIDAREAQIKRLLADA